MFAPYVTRHGVTPRAPRAARRLYPAPSASRPVHCHSHAHAVAVVGVDQRVRDALRSHQPARRVVCVCRGAVVGQVATVISSIRPFVRVCQGVGHVVGIGHHAGRGGHRLAVVHCVVLVGEERVVPVRGPGQAVQGATTMG
jgi:hypothetical protein